MESWDNREQSRATSTITLKKSSLNKLLLIVGATCGITGIALGAHLWLNNCIPGF
jgi:hypothetical protein